MVDVEVVVVDVDAVPVLFVDAIAVVAELEEVSAGSDIIFVPHVKLDELMSLLPLVEVVDGLVVVVVVVVWLMILVLVVLPQLLGDSRGCGPAAILILVIGGGGNISSGDGSSNTDDIGERVGEGRKQIEPAFN